jgi:hypothetical protein
MGALPTTVKSWQYVDSLAAATTNIFVPAAVDASTTCRNAMFEIKRCLTSFASSPWTVAGSSNSVAAGMDAVDRWAAATNIVGNSPGVAHSWIVLHQAATGIYVCIDMASASMASATVVLSTNVFTGGTVTARPTSVGEFVRINNTAWGATAGLSNNNVYVNCIQSTDGEATIVATLCQNNCTGLMFANRPLNPSSAWANPLAFFWSAGTAESVVCSAAYICNNIGNIYGRGTATMAMFGLIWGNATSQASSLFTSTNDLDVDSDGAATLPFLEIGVGSLTVANRGIHGKLVDMWLGQVTPGVTGDAFPSVGARQYAVLGDVYIPWQGQPAMAVA